MVLTGGIILDFMNWSRAISLLEKGEASVVVTQVVLMSYGGKVWMSFDGTEWEETDSKMARREVE